MPTITTIDAAVCERLVNAASGAKVCPMPVPQTSAGDGLAAVADAIALATFALGLIVAFATIGWFLYVRHRTREEAKAEVEKVPPAHIKAHLEGKLPGMVAEALAALTLTAEPGAPNH